MRAGACTIQQTLTAEAASVLKHSLNLARRRGHAQATPLHVAATLLSSRTSLLRNACLKSHPHSSSHPLQCRALELCFNVALNRLPTTPGPLFHGQHSLSNALIAAVKRAQAHQRRGCIEQQQQQQPLLAIKVELEQLVISILDDPSVSRVMREAGFSSTCVKNNLEVSSSSSSSILQCYSSNGLIGSLHFPTESRMEVINHDDFRPTYFVNSYSEKNSVLFPSQKKNFVSVLEDSNSDNEDFRLILDVLMKKKKNTVIVGDYSSDTEGLVLEFMRKIEKGEVPEGLRAVKFVKFIVSLVTLKFMKRDDVEKNIANLRKQVNSLVFTGGGCDICRRFEMDGGRSSCRKNETSLTENMSDYSSVSHMIQEISKIISDFSNFTSKVWLMATANYQTLMKCQMKQPPLETQWAFQAVQVPSGGLALSLHYSSDIGPRVEILQNPSEVKPNEEQDKLMCCSECTSNFEKEAGVSISTSFTSWLHYNTSENKPKDVLLELKRKWNRFCHVLHRPRGSNIPLKSSLFNHTSRSSTYPFFSASLKYNHNDTSTINKSMAFSDTDLNPKSHFDFISSFRNYDSTNEFTVSGGNFRYSDNQKYQSTELSLSSLKKSENKDKVFLALGNSLFSESPTSIKRNWSESQDLCQELQENIPWQAETIRMITQILPNFNKSWKGGTWLLLQGNDWIGKRRLARAMAELYCGSSTQLLRITTEMINENENSCIDSLFEILKGGKMCVILIENVDFMDTHLLALLEHGFKTGDIEDPNGKPTELSQAIFILSTGIFKDSEQDLVIQMKLYVDDQTKQISDSKNRKRAAESDLSNSQKFLKTDEKEWSILMNTEKKVLRLSIPKDLDLNIQVEEEDHNLDESNAVSSDLTQESSIGFHSNKRFIDMIKNKFVFEQNPYQIVHMKEIFLSKMRNSLHELGEIETEDDFFVDQNLLKELVYSSPSFLIQLFEKWLKDVLQTSFKTVKNGGKNSTLRLSLDLQGAKEAKLSEFGFGGSCLPKRIHSEH